jgi:hypothetical protein
MGSRTNGWDPERPPRLFVHEKNNIFEFIKIDPDWEKYNISLPILSSGASPDYIVSNIIKLHKLLSSVSVLYKKIYLGLSSKYSFLQFLEKSGKLTYKDSIDFRRKKLLERGRLDWKLGEGDAISASNLDGEFVEPLSPIYEEAANFTRYSLGYIQQMTRQDGVKLVILAASEMGLGEEQGSGALKLLKKYCTI